MQVYKLEGFVGGTQVTGIWNTKKEKTMARYLQGIHGVCALAVGFISDEIC